METIRLEISKEKLQFLFDNDVLSMSEIKILVVDDISFDYSKSELWRLQKDKSNKAYKDLKKIEFNLRHG